MGTDETQLFVRWTSHRAGQAGRSDQELARGLQGGAHGGRVAAACCMTLRRTAARTSPKRAGPDRPGWPSRGTRTASMWERYNIQTEADVDAAFRQ